MIDKGIGAFWQIRRMMNGGYTAYGAKSSESISQTVIALSARMVIDCNEDERFTEGWKRTVRYTDGVSARKTEDLQAHSGRRK